VFLALPYASPAVRRIDQTERLKSGGIRVLHLDLIDSLNIYDCISASTENAVVLMCSSTMPATDHMALPKKWLWRKLAITSSEPLWARGNHEAGSARNGSRRLPERPSRNPSGSSIMRRVPRQFAIKILDIRKASAMRFPGAPYSSQPNDGAHSLSLF
jgi:hypothetical protein